MSAFLIVFISILLLEFCYRFYIIDFYEPEFKVLNSEDDTNKKDVDLLVFGDSFSASANNFPSILREKYKNKVIINTSVPGFGLKQINVIAKSRIKKYNPKAILYQVYVGNDLIDINHLSNWKNLSLARNLYWSISDRLIFTSYLNFRLAGIKFHSAQESNPDIIKQLFSVEAYNSRTKLYAKADSDYLYNSVTISDDFKDRYSIWKKKLSKFLSKVPEGTKIYIMFIPHCAQVNEYYYQNLEDLGLSFNKHFTFNELTYGFIEKANKDFELNKNLKFLNPLAVLRKNDSINNRLYYSNDPHMNETGNIILANYLEEQLILTP